MFTKMEQAERMREKLRTWEMEAEIQGNFDKAIELALQADSLEEAIIRIKTRQARVRDWEVFHKAVDNRTQLDIYNEIRRDHCPPGAYPGSLK